MNMNFYIPGRKYSRTSAQAVELYHAMLLAPVGTRFAIATPQRTVVVTVTKIEEVTP